MAKEKIKSPSNKLVLDIALSGELKTEYNEYLKKYSNEDAKILIECRIQEIINRYYSLAMTDLVDFRESEIEVIKQYFFDKHKTITNMLLCPQMLEKKSDAISRTTGRKLATLSRHQLYLLMDRI